MGKEVWARPGVKQCAVALGYALVYSVVVRVFAEARWPATAALRMACLLLVPYRYWPALVLGEVIPLAELNLECLHPFGWRYAVLASVPPIALGMPVAWWFRFRAGLFPTAHLVDVKRLICCVLALTILWATTRFPLLYFIRLPNGPYQVPEGTLFLYLLNFYMAMLTAAPWIVMIRNHDTGQSKTLLRLHKKITPLITKDVIIAAFALALLAYLHQVVIEMVKPATMMALFLPAAWLAIRHGWWAAALGGTLSLITTWILLERWPSGAILQAQIFMAFAMTCLYTFGARASSQWRLYEQALRDTREVQKVAKEALVSSQLRLQSSSQALECVASIMCVDHEHLLECYVPEDEREEYSAQAMDLRRSVYRMAENLHPSAWRERGPGAAFYETIGRTLGEADIDYGCEIPWSRLRFLSPSLQTGLYRTTCEAIAWASASPACGGICLTMRLGKRKGIYWVALRIESDLDDMRVARATLQSAERQRIAPKLGATMLKMEELHQMARLFDGKLRLRSLPNGIRISALLWDSATQAHPQIPSMDAIRLLVA
jgi:hypothetical protein